jgi:hypothetical protein
MLPKIELAIMPSIALLLVFLSPNMWLKKTVAMSCACGRTSESFGTAHKYAMFTRTNKMVVRSMANNVLLGNVFLGCATSLNT